MENKKRIFTKVGLIKNEQPITANDLLNEIKPLLDDYFFGGISFDGNVITYCLPNGQKFILKAEAAA